MVLVLAAIARNPYNRPALHELAVLMEVMRWPSTACQSTAHACGGVTALRHCGVVRSLHSVHDEEKPFEMELAWICEASGREFKRVPAELAAAAERQAKAALADSDMCALHYTRLLSAGSLHACKCQKAQGQGCAPGSDHASTTNCLTLNSSMVCLMLEFLLALSIFAWLADNQVV